MLQKCGQFQRLYSSFKSSACPATQLAHIPVLCHTAINYLQPTIDGSYIDMTFGAGGHSRKLLESSENSIIYALDRDPTAHKLAQNLSSQYKGRLVPLLGKFSELPRLLHANGVQPGSVDGILFDFGCSSMQFDEATRGFAVSHNGPIDMRMDRGCSDAVVTAADVLARAEESDLARIFRIYGEEKYAKKIARAIVEARTVNYRIETTKQLADLVAACLSESCPLHDQQQRHAHPATKIFQALRIFVNNELNEINYGLLLAHKFLRKDGRLVAIAFHSLEDTIVKRHMSGNIVEGLVHPVPLKYCNHDVLHDEMLMKNLVRSKWQQLHRNVIVPDESEIVRNPRSRSAKLRAATKIN